MQTDEEYGFANRPPIDFSISIHSGNTILKEIAKTINLGSQEEQSQRYRLWNQINDKHEA